MLSTTWLAILLLCVMSDGTLADQDYDEDDSDPWIPPDDGPYLGPPPDYADPYCYTPWFQYTIFRPSVLTTRNCLAVCDREVRLQMILAEETGRDLCHHVEYDRKDEAVEWDVLFGNVTAKLVDDSPTWQNLTKKYQHRQIHLPGMPALTSRVREFGCFCRLTVVVNRVPRTQDMYGENNPYRTMCKLPAVAKRLLSVDWLFESMGVVGLPSKCGVAVKDIPLRQVVGSVVYDDRKTEHNNMLTSANMGRFI
ncbi:hypothetical protein BCR37DRAFT_382771 [Protomyces lactucae-debilis]|uniref:Uncharacterized protein n=1 Tax=Protomyces lactucae-debilis TaxID=2754530 RepID=A0A1Y2F0A2_PROLT|nr:uncharacterized protein BCR37DRAFT_382771 [Protomyces lactucae-debilis]ORY77308.1 hypothetical protein BCR37DRAFT_382771 [Protomyces lactucae-debilis]